jgi:hypothetical protein
LKCPKCKTELIPIFYISSRYHNAIDIVEKNGKIKTQLLCISPKCDDGKYNMEIINDEVGEF